MTDNERDISVIAEKILDDSFSISDFTSSSILGTPVFPLLSKTLLVFQAILILSSTFSYGNIKEDSPLQEVFSDYRQYHQTWVFTFIILIWSIMLSKTQSCMPALILGKHQVCLLKENCP